MGLLHVRRSTALILAGAFAASTAIGVAIPSGAFAAAGSTTYGSSTWDYYAAPTTSSSSFDVTSNGAVGSTDPGLPPTPPGGGTTTPPSSGGAGSTTPPPPPGSVPPPPAPPLPNGASSTTVAVGPFGASITMTKTASLLPGASVSVGQVVTYAVTVKNTGSTPAYLFEPVTDTELDGTPVPLSCLKFCTTTLAPGAWTVYTGTERVSYGDIVRGYLGDTAQAAPYIPLTATTLLPVLAHTTLVLRIQAATGGTSGSGTSGGTGGGAGGGTGGTTTSGGTGGGAGGGIGGRVPPPTPKI